MRKFSTEPSVTAPAPCNRDVDGPEFITQQQIYAGRGLSEKVIRWGIGVYSASSRALSERRPPYPIGKARNRFAVYSVEGLFDLLDERWKGLGTVRTRSLGCADSHSLSGGHSPQPEWEAKQSG
jgi:hypothetical protein